jgi:hypothetical protein
MTAIAPETGRATRPFHVDVPDEALTGMLTALTAFLAPYRQRLHLPSLGGPRRPQ